MAATGGGGLLIKWVHSLNKSPQRFAALGIFYAVKDGVVFEQPLVVGFGWRGVFGSASVSRSGPAVALALGSEQEAQDAFELF